MTDVLGNGLAKATHGIHCGQSQNHNFFCVHVRAKLVVFFNCILDLTFVHMILKLERPQSCVSRRISRDVCLPNREH